MAQEWKLQDPGEGIHEAEIVEILAEPGDEVDDGDILLVVETDKAQTELPSPYTGRIESIEVEVGQVAEVGDLLMRFSGAEDEAEAEAEEEAAAEAEEAEEEEEAAEAEEEEEAAAAEDDQEAAAEAEEDQEAQEEEREAEEEAEEEEREAAATGEAQWPEDRPVPASPATRRLARELGIDLHQVPASNGRVTQEDVRAFAEEGTQAREDAEAEAEAEEEEEREAAAAAETEAAKPEQVPDFVPNLVMPELPDFSQWGELERQPLRGVRRRTAQTMAMSWGQIPHVTNHELADVTDLESFRQEHSATVEEAGGQLTMTVLTMKAVVAALKEYPRFNASLDVSNEEIVLKHYYNIGIAVDTEDGLIVPVVHDADRKSITDLAVELADLAERVRSRDVAREELQGGTFTITNVGGIGGTAFTPIIRFPEVAILGMTRARWQPVVQGEGKRAPVENRLMMGLSLSFDHRVNDGADAARFLDTLREVLSEPQRLLLTV